MARPWSLEQSPPQREDGHTREPGLAGSNGEQIGGERALPSLEHRSGPTSQPCRGSNPGEPSLEVGVAVLVITGPP